MTFLPIAERELRVAARRKGTYWSRLAAAALTLLIFAGVVAIAEFGNQGWGNQIGTILFAIFSWLSFAYTSDTGKSEAGTSESPSIGTTNALPSFSTA